MERDSEIIWRKKQIEENEIIWPKGITTRKASDSKRRK
jgi:hypothetical protein